MKKIISVICIVALLVTSLGVTFMNVAAAPVTDYQDGDTVIWPTFTDDEGNDWYPYGPSDAPIPESVISTGTASIVENTTGLPFTGLFSIPTTQTKADGSALSSIEINTDYVSVADANGVMVYVEVPEVDAGTYNIGMKLKVYDASTGKVGYKNRNTATGYYYRSIDSTSYTSVAYDSTYKNIVGLPSGFKGYVYYVFKQCTNDANSNTNGGFLAEDSFAGLYFYLTPVEGQDLVVGTPIIVKGDFSDTQQAPTDTITVGGLTYKLDGTGLVDTSTETPPQNLNVGTVLNEIPLSDTGITSSRTFSSIDSITPLTDVSSVKLQQYYNTTSLSYAGAVFNYGGSDTTTANPWKKKGVMFYVDFSCRGSSQTGFTLTVTACNASGANSGSWSMTTSSSIASTGKYYYLADGDSAWTEQTVSSDTNAYAILPNGFKGFVYVYEPMHSYAANRTYIKSIHIKPLGAATSTYHYISAPIAVEKFDKNSTVVYYKNKAGLMDIATGEQFKFDYTGSDIFYGDASQLHVHSAPTIKPATLAKANVYHPLSSLKIDGTDGVFSAGNSSMRPNMSVSVNNKIVPIMDIPAFEVTTKDTFTSGSGAWVSYNTSIDITANSGIVLYVKNHNDVAKNLSIPNIKIPANNTENPYPFSGTSQYRPYRSNNDNYIKMLDVNNHEYWQSVDVSGTYFTLPANFEGYLYFAFEGFDGILALLNDTTTYAEYLKVTSFSLNDSSMAAGQTMTVSLPMHATDFSASDYVSPVAYVNDAVAPQNIITDKFAIPYDHNGDMKVDILDLVRAKGEGTADYASMRKNYLDIAVDAQAVISNPS